jgi:hypothetical protein
MKRITNSFTQKQQNWTVLLLLLFWHREVVILRRHAELAVHNVIHAVAPPNALQAPA